MRFGALRAPWYKGYLTGGSLLMAGDNAEHALSYFAMWQLFHSPVLAGFAVIAHWMPHLLLSIPLGALADRFDGRRIIQAACGIFMLVSVAWGVLLATGSLQPWHCVVLLLLHGFASALWHPADQVMLYDMVGERDLPSAVRLMATGLSLGQLVGPAIGAALLFTTGAAVGLFLNAALYVPFLVYLWVLPLDGHGRGAARPHLRLRDVFGVVRELPRYPAILVVMALEGAIGLLIGTALLPLFPEFGELLGQDQDGLGYGLLIVAMAAGAVVGGLGLEAMGRASTSARAAAIATLAFGVACLVFGLSRSFPLSLAALFVAGIASIVSSSTSQTVVQLQAPEEARGRFVGANAVTSMGFRVGSGIVIGAFSSWLGVPLAVVVCSAALSVIAAALLGLVLARGRALESPARAAAPAPDPAP